MGLGIANLQTTADAQHRASVEASAYLSQHMSNLADATAPFRVAVIQTV